MTCLLMSNDIFMAMMCRSMSDYIDMLPLGTAARLVKANKIVMALLL